jgi:hypothetical protein
VSEEEALHRLDQAWKYAAGDVRRTFLIACYREHGATRESMIQIMGQVNVIDLAPRVAACAPAVRLGVDTGSSWRRLRVAPAPCGDHIVSR